MSYGDELQASNSRHSAIMTLRTAVSSDGKTAYVDVAYTVDKFTMTQLHDATAAASITRAAGVQTNFTGELAQAAQKAPSSELIGIAVAIVVLLGAILLAFIIQFLIVGT